MALDKYSKGLEVDEYGNVVGEKYDRQLRPGDHPIVPVVVDENPTHEALKRVAAEDPNLESTENDPHYIQVEQPAPLEGPVSAAPNSVQGGGTQRSPVYEQVLEQDAKNKADSAKAVAKQSKDSEADGAEAQAAEAKASAERAQQRAEQPKPAEQSDKS